MKQIIYIFTLILLTSCCQTKSTQTTSTATDNTKQINNSTIKDQLKETYKQEDLPANEYLSDKLKPIKVNYKRINSITSWTSMDIEELSESVEGGEAKFYYQDKQLQKVVQRHFGEMSQWLTEYYLLNEQLSFVLERRYQYNFYFLDKEFDFAKSVLIEDRSYFESGRLIHQINNQYCGSPFSDDYLLEEEKRLKDDFNKLIKLAKERKS